MLSCHVITDFRQFPVRKTQLTHEATAMATTKKVKEEYMKLERVRRKVKKT